MKYNKIIIFFTPLDYTCICLYIAASLCVDPFTRSE